MGRRGTRHSTLLPGAARVAKALKKGGYLPHPGPIDPKGGKGGSLRIKISSDPSRTRIRVAGGGVQELFLYGEVEINAVWSLLSDSFGSQVMEAIADTRH
uniref:Uncharacterized protein n=1 Tax=Magnetococcus massalia (strain MO-1) TaxID=451514 RepID=A0A1S7LJ48_MAGMO|nr:protein of unknown function [Candidatus Magnetococcus massalia]